jgi:hypothetical protein
MTALPVPPDADTLVTAAYGLAVRITGDNRTAEEVLERVGYPVFATGYLNAVRRAARTRRVHPRDDVPSTQRPERMADVAVGDWEVVERVALRGMSLTEVAQVLEIDRREALLRLNRGMRAARERLVGGEARDDPGAAGVGGRGLDRSVRRLDDATHDRQAETAAGRSVPS